VSNVRLKPTVAGVILVALGVVGGFYGRQTYLRDVSKTTTDSFQVSADVKETSYWQYGFRFETSTSVSGNGTVTSGVTGQSGEVSFLVMDRTNFENWKLRQPGVQFLVKIPQAPARFEFSFTTTKNETYYFVFDNYYSSVKQDASLVVRYQYVKIVKEPYVEYTYAYGGVGLAILGAIVLSYGLLKKPEIRWA